MSRFPVLAVIRQVIRRLRNAFDSHRYTPETRAEQLRRLGAQVGEGCYIVPEYVGEEPYLVKIGNHVAIAKGVTFITHDGAAWLFRAEQADLQVFGPIVIHDNCFIGQNTILCPNIRIGPNAVVAAGSVVIADVPPNTIVAGVPARPWGSVEKYRLKCLERWAEQRPPDTTIEPGETWWNSRHHAANRERLKRRLLQVFRADLG